MKMTVLTPMEVQIRYVRIDVPNRYGDEDIPADFPGLDASGKRLVMEWDIDTGAIKGWPAGRSESLHLKVTDEGSYYLLAGDGSVMFSRSDCYVPHCVVPGEYGDYVVFDIDANGVIQNYRPKPDEFPGND